MSLANLIIQYPKLLEEQDGVRSPPVDSNLNNAGFEDSFESDHFAAVNFAHLSIKKRRSISSYNTATFSRTIHSKEQIHRRSDGKAYIELVKRERTAEFSVILRKRGVKTVTIAFGGAFFILVAVALIVGTVGLIQTSPGMKEASLIVMGFALVVGVFASDRVVRESAS